MLVLLPGLTGRRAPTLPSLRAPPPATWVASQSHTTASSNRLTSITQAGCPQPPSPPATRHLPLASSTCRAERRRERERHRRAAAARLRRNRGRETVGRKFSARLASSAGCRYAPREQALKELGEKNVCHLAGLADLAEIGRGHV